MTQAVGREKRSPTVAGWIWKEHLAMGTWRQ